MNLSFPPVSLLVDASLFLDLDGTLIEFADRPDAIEVGEPLRDLLRALIVKFNGRVAVISGRSLSDLSDRLAIADLSAAGSHGLESRRSVGRVERFPVPEGLAAVIAEACDYARRHDLVAEPKPSGIALHFRSDPAAEAGAVALFDRLASRHGLIVQRGAMVVELRPPGPDKGSIVRQFMAEPPFSAGSPVVVGDDLTDEDAFAAGLALGGTGILVGADRPTAARFRLPSVSAVRQWLRSAL